ncbi:MAG TPA: SRPBCC family protein [Candidatus Binatia bacterium]|nr:SRPBCC family protein [Candidatus Binatia bacterium]
MKLVFNFNVAKAPNDVFKFIATDLFENHQKWDPSIAEITKLTKGPVGKGTKGQEVHYFLGKRVTDFEFTDYQPNKTYTTTNTSGPFWLVRTYGLKPAGAGTAVNFVFDLKLRTKAIAPLYPLLKIIFKKEVNHNVGLLKELLASSV